MGSIYLVPLRQSTPSILLRTPIHPLVQAQIGPWYIGHSSIACIVCCGCPLLQLSEVERLLTVGSSVYSLDSNGDTPLDLASRAGSHVSYSPAHTINVTS